MESSNPGLSFAAQPAALTIAVSFTDSAKPHLTVKRFNYSRVGGFLLSHATPLANLRPAGEKCFHREVPWDFLLILFCLAVILPWRGRVRMKKLLAMPQVSRAERLNLYFSTIVFQWGVASIVAWRCRALGYTLAELGLLVSNQSSFLLATLLGSVLVAAFQWFNLRRVSKIPKQSRGPLQAVAERILPQSLVELLPYAALALTAGMCEEFLYRGFAMAFLGHLGLQLWLVVILSSLLFGLAHSYQGPSGMASTLLVGLLFGAARVRLGSLIPVMFWHSSVDLIAGIGGSRYLVTKNSPEDTSRNVA
jgi:uncharacterized protein